MKFKEHDGVELRVPFPAFHLLAGSTGTIVHIYPSGNVVEVEFPPSQYADTVVATLSVDELNLHQ
jgi:hypothetical protein